MTPETRPVRPHPDAPDATTRAVVGLACLASDCHSLAAELRSSGVHPRTRLLCSSILTRMLGLIPTIESLADDGRPSAVEIREAKKVKRALGKVA